ncbi:MAG TPA: hypothetical protein VFI29_11515 [Hanamia sp.]|nr:hypothetical protein [Hanamia sp.]
MENLYQNKYRISSARLQTWDYANEGMYFVTICTRNRECYFGQIGSVETQCIACLQQQMQLSELGIIAQSEWIKSIELRRDMNLELGEFVIMPNHMHGIIIIGENDFNRRDAMHRVSMDDGSGNKDAMHGVSTNRFGPQSKNLSSICRGYKSAVTTYARKMHLEFDWQPRFHDHIIRSAEEYIRISNYILNNADKWRDDKFYKPI